MPCLRCHCREETPRARKTIGRGALRMKAVYATPGDHYIALHDDAADNWVLTHLPEFRAMAKEAFPDGYRASIGDVRARMDFLNRQAGIRAGFPTFDQWCKTNGHSAPQTESAA